MTPWLTTLLIEQGIEPRIAAWSSGAIQLYLALTLAIAMVGYYWRKS